jgi:undecaprenyl diphosphate synthase
MPETERCLESGASAVAEGDCRVPRHLAVIIDGNRRWAKKRRLPSLEGHRRGLEKVKKLGKWCKEKGVKVLTLFAFSTENWDRSKAEVKYLMRLLKKALSKKNVQDINKEGMRIRIIGQRDKLPKEIQDTIKTAEDFTKENKNGILNIAFSYGGRAEIINAIENIVKKNPLPKITESLISQNLWTAGEPDPDLIIRTGGEERMSNFLIWQAAYSELYFSKKYWPDFTEEDLDEALREYSRRQRRFGK